jgi:23S rRNA pseudouridine2605 synthase
MVSCMFMEKRLQKILSELGVASRRKAEELILGGGVTVNGKIATIGMKADAERDHIKVGGKLVSGPNRKSVQKVYLMWNKPKNVVTTLSDPQGRPTVRDYLKDIKCSVFPVGRLDFDSEGLILLTNDGDFANAVMHPSREIPKTYLVKVKGEIEEEKLEKLRRGVKLEDGMTLPARAKKVRKAENNSWIEMTIYEGRKRQIRRMLEKVGHLVLKLKRIAIDGLKLKGLMPGELRPLTQDELHMIKKELGIKPSESVGLQRAIIT